MAIRAPLPAAATRFLTPAEARAEAHAEPHAAAEADAEAQAATSQADLPAIARAHQLEALVVMERAGAVLRATGDSVTCRALAAYAASAGACGCDGDGEELERSCCGRICVARRMLQGREVLVAAIARSVVRAAEEVVEAALSAVRGDASPDASGVFARFVATA